MADHLRSIGPFLYRPNPGNAGDSLIAAGTIQFFEEEGLDWEFFSPDKFKQNKNLVFGGGGAFVPLYPNVREFIETHIQQLESFTLLPHTIDGNEDLLGKLDDRFTLFAREKVSAAHLEAHLTQARFMISHDMALSLRPHNSGTPEKLPLFLPGQSLRRQLSWQLHRKRLERARPDATGVQLFMRTDQEARNNSQPATDSIVDLSDLLGGKADTKEQIQGTSKIFLSMINQQKSILTDRLHVAIGAGLCKVPCRLEPGSYYKNQAIFEHSISKFFPSVSFGN